MKQAGAAPLRFETLRVGVALLAAEGHTIQTDLRLLRGSDDAYRVFEGVLTTPFPTLEGAVANAESAASLPEGTTREVRWRLDLSPVPPDEHPCPICGAPAPFSARYPRRLCPACVLEASDADGRSLRFENTGPSGGLEGWFADDGTRYERSDCFVRGVECRAEEHHFGGIVVQTEAS